MDCDGQVLTRLSVVQIMVQGFLTALPECELVLNDSKRRSNNLLPVTRHMITMDKEQLHPAVNQQLFDAQHRIRFRCMEAIRFEAVRFQASVDVLFSRTGCSFNTENIFLKPCSGIEDIGPNSRNRIIYRKIKSNC